MTLPYLTHDLPGIGGKIRQVPEDFIVREELPYAATGAGDHVLARIRKRDCTTPYLCQQLATALGVAVRDLGYAGMKDRRAVTEQWVSLPPPVTPEQVLALELPEITILEALRHPHKLRTGHVRANHFELTVREVGADAAQRASAVLAALTAAPGAPNWYGEQRFGRDRDNAEQGLALVRRTRRFERDGRKNRLLLSALQSQLFNRYLQRRVESQRYRRVLEGDLLRKVGGGVFASTEPAVDEPRLLAGEVVVTGPMFGVEMRAPAPGSAAEALEREVLAEAGLTLAELGTVRKLAPGARRDASIAVLGASVEPAGPAAIRVRFTLPGGAYATAVLRELQKPAEDAPGTQSDDRTTDDSAGDDAALDAPDPADAQAPAP